MKRVVRKLFISFEKEEKWLNEMAAMGLNFIDYSFGRYLFEEGTPGEYIYRLELLKEMPSNPESMAYIRFMEEAGVECVSTFMRWAYFRKRASEGSFDLYSDYNSRINHYKRVSAIVGTGGIVNIIIGASNLAIGLLNGRLSGFYFNAYISTISWALGIGLTFLFVTYIRKIRRMKREKEIYE